MIALMLFLTLVNLLPVFAQDEEVPNGEENLSSVSAPHYLEDRGTYDIQREEFCAIHDYSKPLWKFKFPPLPEDLEAYNEVFDRAFLVLPEACVVHLNLTPNIDDNEPGDFYLVAD